MLYEFYRPTNKVNVITALMNITFQHQSKDQIIMINQTKK